MSASIDGIRKLQEKVWQGSLPLHITLSPVECRKYDDSFPYLIQYPRISYLPFLLPRLHSFFASALIDPDVSPHEGWFSFEGVPLKWQHPVGLLYDLFSGTEPASLEANTDDSPRKPSSTDIQTPWRIVLHFTSHPSTQLIPLDAAWKVPNDAFINSVKEADFLRNGTAKTIMSLSKVDSTALWQAVQDHDLKAFNGVNGKFLNPPGGLHLRHVPVKVYLPAAAGTGDSEGSGAQGGNAGEEESGETQRGKVKVVQGLVTPMLSAREPQTLGTALHNLLPTLFQSRRLYIHARAVLHGAVVPQAAPMQDLMRAAYADGFLHIVVKMIA